MDLMVTIYLLAGIAFGLILYLTYLTRKLRKKRIAKLKQLAEQLDMTFEETMKLLKQKIKEDKND